MNLIDFMPAFIGLLGVLLGGFLQITAQRRKTIEDQVLQVRQQSSKLATATTNYSIAFSELVQEMNNYTRKMKEEIARFKGEEKELTVGIIEELSSSLFRYFGNTVKASLALSATKDHRVATQSTVLRQTVVAAHEEIKSALYKKSSVTPARGEELTQKINTEVEILLGMITPRRYESFLRFRKRETAQRMGQQENGR